MLNHLDLFVLQFGLNIYLIVATVKVLGMVRKKIKLKTLLAMKCSHL